MTSEATILNVPRDLPRSLEPEARLLIALGRALHRYGAPAHRLEAALAAVSRALDLEGDFFCTPTAIFASFSDGTTRREALLRAEPGEIHLSKLAGLDAVIRDVIDGVVTAEEAEQQVRELGESAGYSPYIWVPAFFAASGFAARFFGGGWREMVAAAIIGLLLAFLALLAQRRPVVGRIYDPLGAVLASFAAIVLVKVLGGGSVYIATLAGMIALLPGLTFTVAMNELATRHLVSGTARLAGAATTFVALGFGVALGAKIGALILGHPGFVAPSPLPEWTLLVALVCAPVSIAVLFQAPTRDLGWCLLSGVVAYSGARLGSMFLGPELGVFLAALMVGVGSNAYAKILDRPATIPLLPGIMLLVPGSIGFSSLFSLMANDLVTGMDAMFQMALVGIALVTGLLVANVALPPRRPI